MKQENIKERVYRIQKHYVGKDCVQIMIPCLESISILSHGGPQLCFTNKHTYSINNYPTDNRRKEFPYYNIPKHYSRRGFMGKITYINQLFDFDKPYIRIGDKSIIESYVVKDNDEALLINTVMDENTYERHMTHDELVEFISKKDSDEKVYYMYPDGLIFPFANPSDIFFSETGICERIEMDLRQNLADVIEEKNNYNTWSGRYLRENSLFVDFIEYSVDNIDFTSSDFDYPAGIIRRYDRLIIFRIKKDNNIEIQAVDARFCKKNDFRVIIGDIPVNKYTLEQLKYIPDIASTNEPTISLRLNPGISKDDIKKAKKMVKELKK